MDLGYDEFEEEPDFILDEPIDFQEEVKTKAKKE